MTLIIRSEQGDDVLAIRALAEKAFPTGAEAKLIDDLRANGDLIFSLIAIVEKTIVGQVTFSKMKAPFRALGLGPIAVLPSHQREGIGSELIRAGINHARRQGWQGIFVLGAPRFYQRFGFDLKRASGFTSRYAGPHFMLLLFDGAHLASGEVVYPRAFAALD